MEQRISNLLVVFLLMFPGKIFAQQKQDTVLVNRPFVYKHNEVRISTVTPDFYSRNLGIVCKQELILQKKTNIPFRFRLGSLEYVNRMEGKRQ